MNFEFAGDRYRLLFFHSRRIESARQHVSGLRVINDVAVMRTHQIQLTCPEETGGKLQAECVTCKVIIRTSPRQGRHTICKIVRLDNPAAEPTEVAHGMACVHPGKSGEKGHPPDEFHRIDGCECALENALAGSAREFRTAAWNAWNSRKQHNALARERRAALKFVGGLGPGGATGRFVPAPIGDKAGFCQACGWALRDSIVIGPGAGWPTGCRHCGAPLSPESVVYHGYRLRMAEGLIVIERSSDRTQGTAGQV